MDVHHDQMNLEQFPRRAVTQKPASRRNYSIVAGRISRVKRSLGKGGLHLSFEDI